MSIQPRGGRLKGDFFIIHATFSSIGNTAGNQFSPIFGALWGTTETDIDVTNDLPFVIRRLRVVTSANAVTGDTVVGFRVNAATAVSRTIATTVVGESASGILSINVAANDLINWLINVTDGAANTVSGMAYLICQRTVE